jgi:hypothetical protein
MTRERRAATAAETEAMEERLGHWAITFLIIIGLWLLLAPFVPAYTGYGWLENVMGGPGAVARFFVGFLFLYFAGIVREKNDMRALFRRLIATRRAGSPSKGGDAEQMRVAVDLLIQGLAAERPETRVSALHNLTRLTGQDLGPDQTTWEAWWRENREGFGQDAS